MGKYEALAKSIIHNIGGKENIDVVTHCFTRLRFQLKDESKVNETILKSIKGVINTTKSGGQYQIVIGSHVSEVYADVSAIVDSGNNKEKTASEVKDNKNIFNNIIYTISFIFQPILGVLTASGMLKGLNFLFAAVGLYKNTSGTFIIINAIGDALFMFLPILLGYTSSKKFGLKPTLGLVIGAAMCYPAIQASNLAKVSEPLYTLFEGTIFSSDVYMTFLNIPILSMNYTSTIIPVIFVIYFASKCEKLFNNIIPNMFKFFFVPMLVLLISLSLAFLLIGPITIFGSEIISNIIFYIRNFSPTLAGVIIGATWQILVIFGMHWALTPVYYNNIITLGYDNIVSPAYGSSYSITGIVLAIFFKTKNKKIKEVSLPSAISAFFGITEPAVYGLVLPIKKTFVINCIVAGIVGGFAGYFDLKKFTIGGIGIFQFPSFVNPDGSAGNIIVGAIGALISLVLSFIITFIIYKDKPEEEASENN